MSLTVATDTISSFPDHSMKAIMASFSSTPSSLSSETSSAAVIDVLSVSEDCFEDGCSICLEPFSSQDPPTVTNCKHDYHLHCILEWSQRSTECPICCQLLVLKDPTSQELLEAAKIEKSMRSRNNIRIVRGDETSHVAAYVNDSDLEERILQHFAAATGRTHHHIQRRRQISSRRDSLEVFPSVSFGAHFNNSGDEMENINYGLAVGSTTAGASASTPEPDLSPTHTSETEDGHFHQRILFGHSSPDGPQRSSPSEFIAFSESVKAKFSAASARYKESLSKSTRGFKEKLLARNSTVKELGRGVQREMSAGIAGVARMIERLDLSSKRTGGSVPFTTSLAEKASSAERGPNLGHCVIHESPNPSTVPVKPMHSSDVSSFD
ncbi:OLC1v1020148C1 [Oldenlandia corymbosa var. corymbosa]|uniref:RING-type E3 ubiquitin transferase n=1 Tax=Oldenlandia corymbosa var. corymbosa TaxID=529605 RepID=A0AAV1EG43_OLDCO|nr:OLC1v1020148C1 [Oldenlandia corymbosa var. corymbosa]